VASGSEIGAIDSQAAMCSGRERVFHEARGNS